MNAPSAPARPLSEMKRRLCEYHTWSLDGGMCPIRGIMDRIGSKWSVLLIMVLAERPHRFGELRRAIPDISQRMLTQTLRQLQQDGLIGRQVHATTPPTVEYRLTTLGETLLAPLSGLLAWAETHSDVIFTARLAHEAATKGASGSSHRSPETAG